MTNCTDITSSAYVNENDLLLLSPASKHMLKVSNKENHNAAKDDILLALFFFEHIQQINVVFCFLTLNIKLSLGP